MSNPLTPSGNRPLEQLKVAELRDELRKRGLGLKGVKKDLFERLEQAIRNERQQAMPHGEVGIPVGSQVVSKEGVYETADSEGEDGDTLQENQDGAMELGSAGMTTETSSEADNLHPPFDDMKPQKGLVSIDGGNDSAVSDLGGCGKANLTGPADLNTGTSTQNYADHGDQVGVSSEVSELDTKHPEIPHGNSENLKQVAELPDVDPSSCRLADSLSAEAESVTAPLQTLDMAKVTEGTQDVKVPEASPDLEESASVCPAAGSQHMPEPVARSVLDDTTSCSPVPGHSVEVKAEPEKAETELDTRQLCADKVEMEQMDCKEESPELASKSEIEDIKYENISGKEEQVGSAERDRGLTKDWTEVTNEVELKAVDFARSDIDESNHPVLSDSVDFKADSEETEKQLEILHDNEKVEKMDCEMESPKHANKLQIEEVEYGKASHYSKSTQKIEEGEQISLERRERGVTEEWTEDTKYVELKPVDFARSDIDKNICYSVLGNSVDQVAEPMDSEAQSATTHVYSDNMKLEQMDCKEVLKSADKPQIKEVESQTISVITREVWEEEQIKSDGGLTREWTKDTNCASLNSIEADSQLHTGQKRKEDDKDIKQQEPTKRQRRWNSGNNLLVEPSKPLTTGLVKEIMSPENKEVSSALDATPKASPTPKILATSRPTPPAVKVEWPANGEDGKQRVVPPPTRPPTTSLKIERFLRPFTLKAVNDLLSSYGHCIDFWMDQIKTHCYVTYSSVDEAVAARNGLYDKQWPPSFGNLLLVEFVDPLEVKMKCEGPSEKAPSVTTPRGMPIPSPTQAAPPSIPVFAQTVPLPPPPPVRERPALPPRKEPELVVPTLDDLFKKTKAKPHIYYLPLTEEQVAAKLAAKGKEQTPKSNSSLVKA